MEEMKEGLWVWKEIGTPQEERPTESTNLDPWGSQSPPTKEYPQAGPRPSHSYVANMQLDLHVGPEHWSGPYPKSCCLFLGYALLQRGLPSLALVGEKAPSLAET